jgi:SAP domain-containing ribonucleoprotein
MKRKATVRLQHPVFGSSPSFFLVVAIVIVSFSCLLVRCRCIQPLPPLHQSSLTNLVVFTMDEKTLKTLTVVELRKELESRGLSATGTKPILLKRLKEALDATADNTASSDTTTDGASAATSALASGGSAEAATEATAENSTAANGATASNSSTTEGAATTAAASSSSSSTDASSTDTTAFEDPIMEQKRKRAEKFGIALVLTEEEKARIRKARFGIETEEDKQAKRKERFGIVTEEDKLKKRKERFGDMIDSSLVCSIPHTHTQICIAAIHRHCC